LLINAPIAVLAAMAASSQVKESKVNARTGYDVAGAVTVTAGLMALVYGFTRAQMDGWAAPVTIALLAAGASLVAAFVVIELRASHPVLPLQVVLDRNRGGSFLIQGLAGLAMFGAFLFLTYYLQQTLHYSALKAGVAFLPVAAGIAIATGGVVGQLLPRMGPRPLLVTGMTVAIGGFLWFTRIGVRTGYLTHLLPPEVVMGFGLGLVLTTTASTALIGVDDRDAGVASALLNTTEQIGFSLGIALLNTIAASATTSYLAAHRHSPMSAAAGVVHGYTIGFVASACFVTLALLVTLMLIQNAKPRLHPPDEAGIELRAWP
jgi:hypothetical protein